MTRRILSPSIRFLIAGSLFAAFLSTAGAPQAMAFEKTTDWTLETITGETINFHETLAKGPVVINIWATWCKPCLKEMPHMNRLAGEFAGQVTFLAINADASKAVAKVAPFIQAKGYDNLIVPLDTGAEVQQILQVSGILPFTVIFDQQGREVYRHIGYKEGDEVELKEEIEALLAQTELGLTVATGKPEWSEAVSATNRLEYSYSTETRREIFDNWLDASYQFGGFRTGLMLKSEAPAEEGDRGNSIEHRFFEFNTGNVSVRAGHFFGIFGRGLVFNSYEDRAVRIDTRLDGITGTLKTGGLTATAFSGTPKVNETDVRAADVQYALPHKINLAVTGMTYRRGDAVRGDDIVDRDWVGSARIQQKFGFGDYYFEYGEKYESKEVDPYSYLFSGKARYANLNLYKGPFSISWENSDYDRFELIPRADGVTSLNLPPSLAREFTWTLINRSPHTLNPNDEVGNNLDIMYSSDNGWTLLASGARIKNHDGKSIFSGGGIGGVWDNFWDDTGLIYQLAYGHFVKDRIGDFRLMGAFAYQDSKGLHQIVMGELTWFATEARSLTLQAEHQHVRLGGDPDGTFNLGAYDEQWFKLEYETAPRWAFAAILEVNNKYPELLELQDEPAGPFPAGQITYTISRGGNLNLWAGKRQAGFLCSGGVCKFEPAFEGVEFFGVFRY